MSAQLKTSLAARGGGRMMVGKMINREMHVQFWIHSNATTKYNVFLGFKLDLEFLRILKLLHIYIFWGFGYLIFASLLHFRPMFPFYTRV